MSFRTKTILILILLSLAPYVITMGILGTVYRQNTESRLREDMGLQLGVMADRLGQSLSTLDNDLRFIASLEIMNDVLTGDIDQRIFSLLLRKKQDLNLIGDFYVTDSRNAIVASSDISQLGNDYSGVPFLALPLHSTFDDQQIGQLIVEYSSDNLTRLFIGDAHLQYHLLMNDETLPSLTQSESFLVVEKPLDQKPLWRVLLAQDRDFAFAVLDSLSSIFVLALVFGVIAIASLAYWLANYILAPILQLSVTAKNITSTQDYSQQVEGVRSDEIGQFSVAFNHMILGMQDMIARVKEEGENRLKLAQEKNRAEMLQTLSNKLSKYLSP